MWAAHGCPNFRGNNGSVSPLTNGAAGRNVTSLGFGFLSVPADRIEVPVGCETRAGSGLSGRCEGPCGLWETCELSCELR